MSIEANLAAGGLPLTWAAWRAAGCRSRSAAGAGAGCGHHGAWPQRRAGEHPRSRSPAGTSEPRRIWRRRPPIARGIRTASWPRLPATNRLSSGLGVLESLLDRIQAAGIPRSHIVLLGFSQGACLTAEFAVRHASRFGGIVVFSGGVIGPPGTRWDDAGRFDGTPVFLGCSDQDSHVPEARVSESAAALSPNGRRRDQAHLSRHGPPRERRRDRLAQELLDSLAS